MDDLTFLFSVISCYQQLFCHCPSAPSPRPPVHSLLLIYLCFSVPGEVLISFLVFLGLLHAWLYSTSFLILVGWYDDEVSWNMQTLEIMPDVSCLMYKKHSLKGGYFSLLLFYFHNLSLSLPKVLFSYYAHLKILTVSYYSVLLSTLNGPSASLPRRPAIIGTSCFSKRSFIFLIGKWKHYFKKSHYRSHKSCIFIIVVL